MKSATQSVKKRKLLSTTNNPSLATESNNLSAQEQEAEPTIVKEKNIKTICNVIAKFIYEGNYVEVGKILANNIMWLLSADESQEFKQLINYLQDTIKHIITLTISKAQYWDLELQHQSYNVITEIKKTAIKLQAALEPIISNRLDNVTRVDLQQLTNNIDEKLFATILSKFQLLQDNLFEDDVCFSMLEEEIAIFSWLKQELVGICKFNKITTRCDDVIKDVLRNPKYSFADCAKYSQDFPGPFLIKLKMLALQGSFHGKKNYQNIIDKINKIFVEKLKAIDVVKYEESKVQLDVIEKILKYLPEELQEQIKANFDKVVNLVITQGNVFSSDLIMLTDIIEKSTNINFELIEQVANIIKKYQEADAQKMVREFKQAINKKLSVYQAKIEVLKDLQESKALLLQLKSFNQKITELTTITEDFHEKFKDLDLNLENYVITNIVTIKEQLFNMEFINKDNAQLPEKRKQTYVAIISLIQMLQKITSEFTELLPVVTITQPIIQQFKEKIVNVCQIYSELVFFKEEDLTEAQYDEFRKYDVILLDFAKYLEDLIKDHTIVLNIKLDIVEPLIDVIKLYIRNARKYILNKIEDLSLEAYNVVLTADLKVIVAIFTKILFFGVNSGFKEQVNVKVDQLLKFCQENKGIGFINRLSEVLKETTLGALLINQHPYFIGAKRRLTREKIDQQDNIEYVLKSTKFLSSDNLSIDILRDKYSAFKDKYDNLLEQRYTTIELFQKIKLLLGKSIEVITWDDAFIEKIPGLLAHIFAIWTTEDTAKYVAIRGLDASQDYLLMPHVAQVIAIFRILGIGYKNNENHSINAKNSLSDKLLNNLVEIETGEGKSVVMAVIASLFALTGLEVNCVCYSETLSTRDYEAFSSLFMILGVSNQIKYGTFNKLCEDLLNEQCNIRDKVRDLIINNQKDLIRSQPQKQQRPKILLIDEVDVFLSDRFYGGMYAPSVYLQSIEIRNLLKAIWSKRACKPLTLNLMKSLPEYQACMDKYSNWQELLIEAVKSMLLSLSSYDAAQHLVRADRIVYLDGEAIADNICYGYSTVWAYYDQHEQHKISQSSLEANVGIIIECGTFSYAQIPNNFAYIAGVSGTLKTLADKEKEVLKNIYAINKSTYMPSVYGNSKRIYDPKNDVHKYSNEDDYFAEIRRQIDLTRNANRAILVFFHSEKQLLDFYNSNTLADLQEEVQCITEAVDRQERAIYIDRSTREKQVTLLTPTFGRGIDFICHSPQLVSNGGVCVLQAFFSKEKSEEYQIMGRGARQGDPGSYKMVLLERDLEWVVGSNWQAELQQVKDLDLYAYLDDGRHQIYNSKCEARKIGIEQRKQEHKLSVQFMEALLKGEVNLAKNFLKERNNAGAEQSCSRTVLLMDATGSMSSLLNAAKETVCTMFERAATVLEEKGLAKDAFQMQFAVYRNYSSKADKILQTSAWETNKNNLRTFMSTISPQGGQGNEAVEIGLWHAAEQSNTEESISQVILIGDAPANTLQEVTNKRDICGGESYWQTTQHYQKPTFYQYELQKLKSKNIPVHAFYVASGAKANFTEIATTTGGRCEELKIQSHAGAEYLTHFVTEEVLRKAAREQGDVAVELYREKYRSNNKTYRS